MKTLDNTKDWPFFIHGRTDVIFIHIPKTAGTSIRYSMGFNEMNKNQNIRNHYTAKEIIEIIGKEKWETSFKFSFVRNPWDRLYSFYTYRLKQNRIKENEYKYSFKKWAINELFDKKKINKKRYNLASQTDWLLNDQNKINIDFIGKFENLNEDFNLLKKTIFSKYDLSHLNRSRKTNSYKSQYDQELKDIVSRIYINDIKQFGYKF